MGLPDFRSFFGIHSVTPYNRVDGTFYGILKVLMSSTLNLTGTTVQLKGGSSKFPFAIEEAEMGADMQLKFSEYPDFVFTLFMGVTPTEAGSSSTGALSTLTNKKGTSVMSATTGIASVSITSMANSDLKFGKYVVVAASASTVNIYASTDIDFSRGTKGSFQDGTLKLVAAAVTITASTGSAITGFGITLMGGSGSIALVTGDTATFEVLPPDTASMTCVIGQVGSTFPEFGAIVMGKKKGTGEMIEADMYRCKAEGLPLHFDVNKFSEADVKANMMYDPTLDGIGRLRIVTPVSPN